MAAKIVQSAVRDENDGELAKEMREQLMEALGVVDRNGGLTWEHAGKAYPEGARVAGARVVA